MIVAGIIIVSVALAAIAAFLFVKRSKKKESNFKVKTIDGSLSVTDVVSWFKSLELDPKTHIPFVAKGNCENFREIFAGDSSNKVQTVIGVFNEKTEEMSHLVGILSDGLDESIVQMLGDEDLVVLS